MSLSGRAETRGTRQGKINQSGKAYGGGSGGGDGKGGGSSDEVMAKVVEKEAVVAKLVVLEVRR